MGSISIEPAMSDSSGSPPPDEAPLQGQGSKRTASEAGLKPNGGRPAKSVKRRASKACQCCRSRKVRCNVVEHGAPCTNCRLDEVECIVSESKRKKKWTTNDGAASPQQQKAGSLSSTKSCPMSAYPPYEPLKPTGEHVPHALYQDLGRDISLPSTSPQASLYTPNMLMNLQRLGQKPGSISESAALLSNMSAVAPSSTLPSYIKPLPSRLAVDDILYLEKKGALSIPPEPLRNQLLRSYTEYLHIYMPLLDIHEFVASIDGRNESPPISILLFQAVMFAAVASVDLRYLKAAGYESRRDARRDFFARTRLLYDFDVEVDRISLIQSLLLMTYWYETPDDQKDSHHWMGIAVSLSHTIGLHRNPEKSPSMDKARQKLWKRIWWSTYMRDRLVALGMRRPTRIKNSDFDVPMLTLDDFESEVLPDGPSCIPADCTALRSAEKQRQFAVLCIEKTKLCLCISHVLSVQYSVLHNNHGVLSEEGSTRTTMMLVAKKLDPQIDEVQACDKELREWRDSLPEEARYVEPSWSQIENNDGDVALNLSLLHMIYYATLSALHRPQVLPSTAMPPRNTPADQLEESRRAVRLAASEITTIANTLNDLDLVRLLPTTGITTLLPAIIIHLLDIKAPDRSIRRSSLQGFCQCMQIMAKLRDIYAAADYSTAFLEAAIRKAEITIPQRGPPEAKENHLHRARMSNNKLITSAQGLMEAGRGVLNSGLDSAALTPPPELHAVDQPETLTDDDIARQLNSYLASTPPDSEHQHYTGDMDAAYISIAQPDFEPDFDSMINLDAAGDTWLLEDGAYAAMQGESSGFTMDVDWMKGMKEGGITPLLS